jgi:outer membrane immunogenic protein
MKASFVAALAVLALVFVPASVSAQSSDVILQRLDALEKENAALRERMHKLERSKHQVASEQPGTAVTSAPPSGSALTAYAKAYPRAEAVSTSASRWNGFYIGAHGGYAGGSFLPATITSGLATNVPLKGGFGGLQTGYNYQFAPHWLLGVEQDVSFGNISGSQSQSAPNPTITASTNYSGTVRERFGYIWDRALLYETAGIAFANNKVDLQVPATAVVSESHLEFGVVLGAGIEWAIDPNLSVKVEYLYSYLSKEQYFAASPFTSAISWPISTARAGVNWRFD